MKFLATVLVLASALAWAAGPMELKPALRSAIAERSGAKSDSTHSYDVKSYAFWIDLPMDNDSLYGHVRMGAVSRSTPLTTVKLNSVNLAIDSAFCDGSAVSHGFAGDTLVMSIPSVPAGSHFLLDIYYRGGNFINNGAYNKGYYWYQGDGSPYGAHTVGYSMAEPQDARAWTPCFDEPWDKADSGCIFYVTVPDSYQVAGNGLLQDTVRAAGKMTWHWKETNPISTYLMCFTASRYAMWSDTARTSVGDTVPLNYFIWPEDSASSRSVFATMPGMIECFSTKYHPYPFEKYGMAAVSPFDYGGMEHQTMTTIHRDWIPSNDQYDIAHELGHMWFGDLITCADWGNIWLNEGFATYSSAVYYEYLNPGAKTGNFLMNNNSAALGGNANTYPIYNEPMSLVFDWSMVYCKGAWVLQDLRWVMGDTAFYNGLHAYCDSFGYGNAVTPEFQRIMEHHYHQPLDWFFNEWVYRAGHPIYTTICYYQNTGLAAKVKIKQRSVTGPLYTMPVALVCSTAAGYGQQVRAWDSLAQQLFTVSDVQAIKRVMLDPDNWILKEATDSVPRLRNIQPGNGQLTAVWERFRSDTVAGYNVYHGLSASGPFTRINPALVTDTMFLDTGLNNGTRYYYAVTAVNAGDTSFETRRSNTASRIPSGVEGGPAVIDNPSRLALETARPNPFRLGTAIGFSLSRAGSARLAVYNALGQRVKSLASGPCAAGHHYAVWNGDDDSGVKVSPGSYFIRLDAEGTAITRTVQLMR